MRSGQMRPPVLKNEYEAKKFFRMRMLLRAVPEHGIRASARHK